MRLWHLFLVALLAGPLLAGPLLVGSLLVGSERAGAAPALVADLSSPSIAITTDFSGAELLLFGAIEGPGDVVVVVRGPARRETVRRKERVAGVWVNGQTVVFEDVPAYYRVASTRPLDGVAPEVMLALLGIGASRLPLQVAVGTPPSLVPQYRAALVRNKTRLRLYGAETGHVETVDGRLFRTTVVFPANVPTGAYGVEVFLLRHGRLVSRFKKSLAVQRAGIEAQVFNFAHERSALYGVIAIVIALMAGWLAGVIFRKV